MTDPLAPQSGPFTQGVGIGLVVPLAAAAFGGLGGPLGFWAALIILSGAAFSLRPSAARIGGILTGFAVALAACFLILAMLMQGFS